LSLEYRLQFCYFSNELSLVSSGSLYITRDMGFLGDIFYGRQGFIAK